MSYDDWKVLIENGDAECSFQKGEIEGVIFYRVEQDGIVEDFTDKEEAKEVFNKKVQENLLKYGIIQ